MCKLKLNFAKFLRPIVTYNTGIRTSHIPRLKTEKPTTEAIPSYALFARDNFWKISLIIALLPVTIPFFSKETGFEFIPTKRRLTSHAGVFREAQISSLPTNSCSTENNIPFPSLANHIVSSKFWNFELDRRGTR